VVSETLEYQTHCERRWAGLKKNTFLVVVATLLLLAWGLYYFLREEPPAPPMQVKETGSDPAANVSFVGSSIVEEQNGKRLWELAAGQIEIDPATKLVHFQDLKGIFYQDNGGKMTLTAHEAVMDPKTRDITLQGDIRAAASDGATFSAPQARWAGTDRRFFGSGGITMTRDDTVITGETIETDANIDKVKVQGQARVLKGATR
jgi:LPS export ABC transporter protein LptC